MVTVAAAGVTMVAVEVTVAAVGVIDMYSASGKKVFIFRAKGLFFQKAFLN